MSFVAVGWLVCQLVAVAAPLSPLVSSDDQCACPGGTLGALCPMHHHSGAPAENPGPIVKNACATPATGLLSLIGGQGVLPQPVPINIDRTPIDVALFVSTPVDRSEVPDSPPPRA